MTAFFLPMLVSNHILVMRLYTRCFKGTKQHSSAQRVYCSHDPSSEPAGGGGSVS